MTTLQWLAWLLSFVVATMVGLLIFAIIGAR